MRAEFAKVRSMPTPRWCLFAVFLCFCLGLVVTVIWGPGEDAAAPDVAVGFSTAIASIVFGVWIVGVEYGQNTIRRTLTADPRRGRLVISKIIVAAVWVTAVTVFLHLVALPAFNLAASGHDTSVPTELLARYGLASLLNNLVYMLIGVAFALITASMAGGMTLSLVFIFVIDSIFPVIPEVGDYSFGLALTDVLDAIRGIDTEVFGDSGSTHSTPLASLIVAAWTIGLLMIGIVRFKRSDVK